MRSVVFRYDDFVALSGALSETPGSLPLPERERVGDGEWVLAIFEIGSRRRATAAAARGVRAAGDAHLEFERRDWERLVGFVAVRSEQMRARTASSPPSSSARIPVAAESAPSACAPTTSDSGPVSTSERAPRSRRFEDLPPSSSLESTRLPFGARILVVDDGRGTGNELRAMLAEMGLVVELAATSKQAEKRMTAQSFDAIVLDLHARGMDARDFVGKLRADARLSDIPVLFLSSRPTSRDVVDAFAIGGDDFLPKPFRPPELAARIFGLLRRARLARASGSGAR